MFDWMEILGHVFLVMVNAVSDLKSAAVEKKRCQGIAKASSYEEFYFWILTFPGCPVE